MSVKFIVAPSFELATGLYPTVTVECEYGKKVVEGRRYTAAHHVASYRSRPAPCCDLDIPILEEGTVLLSHLDLDSLGGALRTLRCFEGLFSSENDSFWDLAQFVDISGPHKLGQSGASASDLAVLYGMWAWSRANVPRPSRTEVTDVTAIVVAAGHALEELLAGDEELLAAGQEFKEANASLNSRTFVDHTESGVVVRHSPKTGGGFVNHLYDTPSGDVGRCVVAFSHATGAVTVSLSEALPGIDCAAELQALYGPEAGGHAAIGGSPRGQEMTLEDCERAVLHFNSLIRVHDAAFDAGLAQGYEAGYTHGVGGGH